MGRDRSRHAGRWVLFAGNKQQTTYSGCNVTFNSGNIHVSDTFYQGFLC